jgi:3-oxoacyl-[acyl-carrier protein] reductase
MADEDRSMSAGAKKIALISGANKGIGLETARQLGKQGITVLLGARDLAKGEAAAAELKSEGIDARAVKLDVVNPADIKAVAEKIEKEFGKLDILVNNAGVYDFKPLSEITPEHYHKQFDINVLGLLLTTKEALPLFGPEGGSVINIGSVVGSMPVPGGAVYCATKAAVDSITVTLSKELGPKGIRVNSLNPGMVETEGFHAAGIAESDFQKMIEAQTPLGHRIGQPQDIGRAAVFFASEDAGWVTGQKVILAGGQTQ